ncbi:MAG: hypothetical protein P8X57_06960 [Cyclobacteriaceae bacterium]
MVRFFTFVTIMLLAGACSTSVQEREIETPDLDSTETVILFDSTGIVVDTVSIAGSNGKTISVKLDCRQISPADADNPLYEVALTAQNQRIPLDTIHACNNFTSEEFAAREIPSAAISACGGWYKDVGEYFFLTEENNDLIVSYVWLKEEQTTNRYPYREIYRLKLPELEQ